MAAKYNNIESTIAKFTEEYEKYGNPYCSYIMWLNRYFTVNGNEPLKEALFLMFHSIDTPNKPCQNLRKVI